MTVKPFRDDLSWKWKPFAGRWLLVTDGGGEQVILSAKHHSSLVTRDQESGMLRDISPSDHVARIIAGAADVRRHVRTLIHGIDVGFVNVTVDDTGGGIDTISTVVADLRAALLASGPA